MSKCPGLHCPGCKGGGGWGLLGALGGVIVILAAIIHHYWATIVEVVQIATLTALSAGGAAATVYVGLAIRNVIRDQPRQLSYRRMNRHRQPATYTISKIGTGATPIHKELADRMNDDLVKQAAHLADERIHASR